MIISRHKIELISTTLREAVLALKSTTPDIPMAIKRIQSIQLTLTEGTTKLDCPKCDSHEVLVGNNEDPNHCSSCGYEWDNKPVLLKMGYDKHQHEHVFKSPETLAVKKKESFENKIDNILDSI